MPSTCGQNAKHYQFYVEASILPIIYLTLLKYCKPKYTSYVSALTVTNMAKFAFASKLVKC